MQWCSCTRRSKTKILTTRTPPSWIEFVIVTSHRQTRWRRRSRKIFWFSIFACSYSIARIKEKTLLFALIKVSTFICKREISGLSSPLSEVNQVLKTTATNKSDSCCKNVWSSYMLTVLVSYFQVIRSGVLWFLRNMNDPDFHPVQEVRKCYKFKRRQWLCYVIATPVSWTSMQLLYKI